MTTSLNETSWYWLTYNGHPERMEGSKEKVSVNVKVNMPTIKSTKLCRVVN